MDTKRWAVLLQPIRVDGNSVATNRVGSKDICILQPLPCPEDGCKNIYVKGKVSYWKSRNVGDIVVLEESGDYVYGSPVFQEVVNE